MKFNKFNFIRKKSVIFLAVILVILASGGFFLWWKNRETPPSKWEFAKVSQRGDYTVKETSEGKLVENKKTGISFKIPRGWILEGGDPSVFYSPNAEFSKIRRDVLKEGCKIYVYANYIKTDLNTLKKFMEADYSKISSVIKLDESLRIKVSNHFALEYKYHVRQDRPNHIKMRYISIDVPSKKYLYKILLSAPLQKNKDCEIKFDKFLKTVSFK